MWLCCEKRPFAFFLYELDAGTHWNTLQYTARHCNTLLSFYKNRTLQHVATHCNTLQHTATHCITLQHTATHCNTLQHTAAHEKEDLQISHIYIRDAMSLAIAVCCIVLQCVAVCCSVLQCVAACCSVLQCVAVCCSVSCA